MARSQSQTVSLADVADAAGVSAQTVSRVVRGSDSVRPETRDKVRAAMDDLGYRPSFAGRSLKAGRYSSIGLVMLNITDTGNMLRLEGITSAAAAEDHAITLMEMAPGETLSLTEASRRMSALPVDGMIFNLNRMVPDFREFKPLPGLDTVIITMLEHPTCSTVDNDQMGCSEMIVSHLLEHGHANVHFISGPELSISGAQREEGYYEALASRGIPAPEVLRGDWTADSGYEAGARLAADPTCTAIYASNDAMAYGVAVAMHDAGKRIPEDVSLVGVDDSLGLFVPHNGLTTVRFDNRQVGLWAFRKVTGTHDMPRGRQHVLIPGTLVKRGTVAAPPSR